MIYTMIHSVIVSLSSSGFAEMESSPREPVEVERDIAGEREFPAKRNSK
jgi:hypothetical protein